MPVQTAAMRRTRLARRLTKLHTLTFVAGSRRPWPPGMINVSSGGASSRRQSGVSRTPDSARELRPDTPSTTTS
jgi:hypothetical protein